MKKLLAATLVASVVTAGSAFASTMPVLDMQDGQTKMNVEYMHSFQINDAGHSENGMAISAEYGIADDIAVQLSHSSVEYFGHDIDTTELVGVYNYEENLNLFAGIMRSEVGDDHETHLQAGVIGYMPVAENVEAFGKFGIGTNDLKHVFQIGATYEINEELDAHAYYEHNEFKEEGFNAGARAYYVGLGYKF